LIRLPREINSSSEFDRLFRASMDEVSMLTQTQDINQKLLDRLKKVPIDSENRNSIDLEIKNLEERLNSTGFEITSALNQLSCSLDDHYKALTALKMSTSNSSVRTRASALSNMDTELLHLTEKFDLLLMKENNYLQCLQIFTVPSEIKSIEENLESVRVSLIATFCQIEELCKSREQLSSKRPGIIITTIN